MELVAIVYRYINRFINSEALIKLLQEMDKTKYQKNEINEIEKLIEDVKQISKTIPIKIDQIERKRKSSINRILKSLEKIKTNEKNSEEVKRFLEKQYDSLIKEKKIVKDSGPRYEKIYHLLVNKEVYKNQCSKMSKEELLMLITEYISAPAPPNINQEIFDELVNVGIKKDKREALWRLAFNYNGKKKDFTLIENYFIEKRDDYYLTELISAVKEDLNMEKLLEKVINTKDKNFIIACGKRAKNIGIFDKEEIEKLKKKINEKEEEK